MRTIFLSLTLATVAQAADGQPLKEAKTALDSTRAALRHSPRDCRLALDSNLAIALRDLELMLRSGTAERLADVQFFVSGMRLAEAVSTCPVIVSKTLAQAQRALASAAPKDGKSVASAAQRSP